MSDLAPFVAATLRDKVVHELQEESKRDREKIRKLEDDGKDRMVRITGPGGSPVYAENHFQYAVRDEDEPGFPEKFALELQNSTGETNRNPNLASCPIQSVLDCEIHLGTNKTIRMEERDGYDAMGSVGDRDVEFVFWFQKQSDDCNDVFLVLRYGPNPTPDIAEIAHFEEYEEGEIQYVRFEQIEITERAVGRLLY